MFLLPPKVYNSCNEKGMHKFTPFTDKHFSETPTSDITYFPY